MGKFISCDSTDGICILNTDAIIFISEHDYLDGYYKVVLKDGYAFETKEKDFIEELLDIE